MISVLTHGTLARRMGLRTNQEKTKYIITRQNAKQSENITTGNYIFEVVQTFTYPGSSARYNNNISQEIKEEFRQLINVSLVNQITCTFTQK
jgi:hypothetical protein